MNKDMLIIPIIFIVVISFFVFSFMFPAKYTKTLCDIDGKLYLCDDYHVFSCGLRLVSCDDLSTPENESIEIMCAKNVLVYDDDTKEFKANY
ncbi:MAG: hypothetical protein DRP15_02210 [Candidatus Aenigmatarchaeota archaeon]|nr:MAG: hypothetical protein DRP15_02210 [Candidatus Aenigmarchaeota archaeon]